MKPLRVVALMAAYNEGDIISKVLGHLIENGVEIYLLDNRSTDDTVEQAQQWLGRGLIAIEPFPASGDDPRYGLAAHHFSLTAILRREEELAHALEADWFVHHDADEIRESPWPGRSLQEAIQLVDALDYNSIDFRVINFPPVDDGFRQGMDPRTYFTRWEPAPAHDRMQLKCWKATPDAISLAPTGGHDAWFEGRRIFPIPFLLRHYPIRGQTHGLRKVFLERKARFPENERDKDWHVQYDGIRDESHCFLRDPGTLEVFDPGRALVDLNARNRLLDESEAHVRRLEGEIARKEEEAARLKSELGQVLGSRTWRWTAPLRRALDSGKGRE